MHGAETLPDRRVGARIIDGNDGWMAPRRSSPRCRLPARPRTRRAPATRIQLLAPDCERSQGGDEIVVAASARSARASVSPSPRHGFDDGTVESVSPSATRDRAGAAAGSDRARTSGPAAGPGCRAQEFRRESTIWRRPAEPAQTAIAAAAAEAEPARRRPSFDRRKITRWRKACRYPSKASLTLNAPEGSDGPGDESGQEGRRPDLAERAGEIASSDRRQGARQHGGQGRSRRGRRRRGGGRGDGCGAGRRASPVADRAPAAKSSSAKSGTPPRRAPARPVGKQKRHCEKVYGSGDKGTGGRKPAAKTGAPRGQRLTGAPPPSRWRRRGGCARRRQRPGSTAQGGALES